MSSFDIARIISTPAPRETAAEVPARTAAGRTPQRPDTQNQSSVSVEAKPVADLANAGKAPVDNERIAQIRTALEQGTYPIKPAKIVDAMIAARLMLSVGE